MQRESKRRIEAHEEKRSLQKKKKRKKEMNLDIKCSQENCHTQQYYKQEKGTRHLSVIFYKLAKWNKQKDLTILVS